jgi:hypothetical protein
VPFGATGKVGGSSIYLPAGASVQSPYTCVDLAYPLFRFFGRNNGLLSTVAVPIVYKEPLLGSLMLPVGVVALNGTWGPSAKMLTLSAVQGLVNTADRQDATGGAPLHGAHRLLADRRRVHRSARDALELEVTSAGREMSRPARA